MTSAINRFLLPLISIIAILAFSLMYGIAFVDTWMASDSVPTYGSAFQYLATALCGLVGGITAKGLGQPAPSLTGVSIQAEKNKSHFRQRIMALSQVVAPLDSETLRVWIASVYILVFVVFGFAAALTWALREPFAPEMIKNLAMIAIGLLIPSLQSFLTKEKNS